MLSPELQKNYCALTTDDSLLFKVVTKIGRNNINFVIDTGACTTILPQRMALALNLNVTPVKLSAANGKDIEYFGKAVVDIGIPTPFIYKDCSSVIY